jgi:hypothetical protein
MRCLEQCVALGKNLANADGKDVAEGAVHHLTDLNGFV